VANYFSSDTIAAIATCTLGDAGIGVLRFSGPQAFNAAQNLCPKLKNIKPRYLHRVFVNHPETKEVLDDGLAVYFTQGESFTGEEVIELQLHGGRFLLQKILQLAITTGLCRLALPGEFSFRAVQNGKMSLQEVQSIKQLIDAQSFFEVQSARKRLSKKAYANFLEIKEALQSLLAQVELSIDFVDQDVEVISQAKMQEEIKKLLNTINKELAQMKAAQKIAQGLRVILVGEPNVGKSTLFNAILSQDRALVSEEPGTTRDVITESISIGPYRVELADTAGIRVGTGKIEKQGIQKTRDLLEKADVVIWVLNLNSAESVFQKSKTRQDLVVINKWDLVELGGLPNVAAAKVGAIPVSALKGEGILELLHAIQRDLDSRVGLGLNSFLPTELQFQAFSECQVSLMQIQDVLKSQGLSSPEILSTLFRTALNAISFFVGETTPDDVLTKIFSEFCIGK